MDEIEGDPAGEFSVAAAGGDGDAVYGDDAAFESFVVDGSRQLLRSAFLLTGDRGLAEDLLQETLMRTARRWERARDAPGAYSHRVLINLLHDRRRWLARRPRERPLDEAGELAIAGADPLDVLVARGELLAAVKRLAPRQREVIVLRFWADLSVADTAVAIGASEGSVKTHTSRALKRLRNTLGAANDEPREASDVG